MKHKHTAVSFKYDLLQKVTVYQSFHFFFGQQSILEGGVEGSFRDPLFAALFGTSQWPPGYLRSAQPDLCFETLGLILCCLFGSIPPTPTPLHYTFPQGTKPI